MNVDEPQFGAHNGDEDAAPAEQLHPDRPLPSADEPPAPPELTSERDPGDDDLGGQERRLGQYASAAGEAEAESAPTNGDAGGFASGEKIASMLDLVFNGPPPEDRRARAALTAIKTARRFGLLEPLIAVFPALDDSEAWDGWLGLALGVCLALISDGVEVDVEVCRDAGAEALRRVFEEVDAEG